MAAAFAALWGPQAGAFFLAQGASFSVVLLQTVTYTHHYGLVRDVSPATGRYEPESVFNSWTYDGRFSNALLLNGQRHAAHHAQPQLPYYALQPQPQAPQLPCNIVLSVLMALVPPLWFAQMNPRAAAASAARRAHAHE